MMKKTLITLLITILINSVSAQDFKSFINYVNNLQEPDRQFAVDSFMLVLEPNGFPYIHGDSAFFIYQGSINSVEVTSDFNDWNPDFYNMTNVGATDFWYYYQSFELNARLDYRYVIDGAAWILDPLNPNTVGENSEFIMPEYEQPWEVEEIPGTPSGTLETISIHSTNTDSDYQVKVYVPYNYNFNRHAAYPTVFFHDGKQYIYKGKAEIVLNNLIANNILDTIIAVFVRPNNRVEEYANSLRNEYRRFFVNELVPYIDENYNTVQNPWGRAVCGSSLGGNISALISYNHSEIFGNCGLHSGAFLPNNLEAFHLIVNGPLVDINWVSVWGSYESSLNENLRDFRDFLIDVDYNVHWQELPEGHSWGLWRATLDELLTFFFPLENTSIPEDNTKSIIDLKLGPNPFPTSTTISYTLLQPTSVQISIFNHLGKQVDFIQQNQSQGKQQITWDASDQPSGMYYFRMEAGDQIATGKLLLVR